MKPLYFIVEIDLNGAEAPEKIEKLNKAIAENGLDCYLGFKRITVDELECITIDGKL